MGSISPFVDSNQLLPVILENRAKTDPYGIWAKFPVSSNSYKEGFRSATHLELHNAVNKVAWLLEGALGRSENFETIGYLGPNDLRSIIVVLAGVKTGYKTFLPSPRNSKAAQISLLTRLDCKVLLTTSPELPCIPMIIADYPVKKLQIPALTELLSATETPSYPYNPNYEEVKNDPIFVLHTSGSTGIPKPLVYTHMFNTCVANVTSLPMKENFVNLNTNFQSGHFFSIFPSFHIVGIGFQLIIPSFYRCIPVYPLPSAPPTTDGFLEVLKYTNVDWAFLPPVLIDELGKNIPSLEFVASKIKYIYFTGGAVPSSTGDIVSSRLPVHQVIGSSECAMFPLIRNETELGDIDWSYIQIHPASNGEFRHRFGDLHELVIVRRPENEKYQAIFTHFPDLQEYETRDLFSPHPTAPGFWKHRSRIDDVIVFLNGEKTNPVTFEQEISRHPDVKSALVVGHQRFEASLLIELIKDEELSLQEQKAMIESVWPIVQQANTQCPAHARVSKSKILLADPALPFLRAPKGTVQRQATLDLYEEKLNKLYLESDSGEPESQLHDSNISDGRSATEVVRELVKRVTEWKHFEIQTISSLWGWTLCKYFIYDVVLLQPSGLPSSPPAPFTRILLSSQEQASVLDFENARIANINATLSIYEKEIDNISTSTVPENVSSSGSEVVLLTGSTGAVGSFLLDTLIQNKSVSTIYCLNRSEDPESLQNVRNKERGISTDFSSPRVVFLKADLTKPNFGLDEKAFGTLASTATRVIHNAWPVDFNKTLQSFHPSLDGVLGLISFAATSKFSPSIFFISSISSVGNYHNTKDAFSSIPERILSDLATPAPMGYGESKYIAERLLDYAAQKLHITAGAARVGQIAGTAENPRGWNRREWFPSLVLSSKFLGAVPETLGLGGNDSEEVDWVPIDQLVRVLAGLALGLDKREKVTDEGVQIFHPVHPVPTTWNSLLPTVIETLASTGGTDIKTVSFQEWVKLLKASSELAVNGSAEEFVHKNPGVKLLDFYESLLNEDGFAKTLKMETKETLESNESLRGLGPIHNEWVQGWIKGWIQT